jgi:kynurenine formamidase
MDPRDPQSQSTDAHVPPTDRSAAAPAAAPADAADGSQRRDFFRTAAAAAGVIGVAGALHGKFGSAPVISSAQAQTTGEKWWPSRWGPQDEAGASNWITPEKVLDAAKWIRNGKVYRIGRVYEQGMPMFGARAFTLRIPGGPTGGPFGGNKLVYNDEFLATEIGQTGTQFDGLGHIGIQQGKDGDQNEMRFYNGVTVREMNDAYGLKKLGIEKVKPFFTRGHLFDVAASKGRMWEAGEEIKVADLLAAMKAQGIKEADIKQGDAVFFNTGWGALWMKNNDKFNGGEPGIGMEVARWCIAKGVCLTGADTWATEVVPNPDKNLAFPVHGELIAKHGIFNHENLMFDELIKDKKYQFVYIFSPAPIKGATGSNGGPIAVT